MSNKHTALELFRLGNEILKQQHKDREAEKLHTLRGGSAGCLLPDGSVIGSCPHEALGRFMGHSLNKDLQQGYFDGGVANEEIWLRNLKLVVGPDKIRCEEEIPIKLEVAGYPLTGRPDMVLGNTVDGIFVPEQGFELKATMAIKSGASKLYGLKPDDKHLCQAGLYAKALGCSWSIPYTIMASGELGYFGKKEYRKDNLVMGKVEFPIEWENEVLHYITPLGKRVKTLITWQGILDYYTAVVEMYTSKSVGWLRLSEIGATGDSIPWNPNEYNEFTNTVTVTDGWEVFLAQLKKASSIPRFIKKSGQHYKVFSAYADTANKNNGKFWETNEGTLLGTTSDLAEARDLFYEEDS
jgi:hypothetical protein